jgi:putative Mg2+ transporter-C (MgtC) family protein
MHHYTSDAWTFAELLHFFGPKLLVAIVCGGIIGLERELKSKAAGIKTNILISVGSTLYTAVSVLISSQYAEQGHFGDPGRLAAQIVSGIGFLGGGAIIQSRGTIVGLTTAATIWVMAAIGVCIGIGYWQVGLGTSILVVAILVATNIFEDRVLGRDLTFACEMVVEDPEGKVRAAVNHALSRNGLLLQDFEAKQLSNQQDFLLIHYSGHRMDHKKFLLDLWNTPGIREVKQV